MKPLSLSLLLSLLLGLVAGCGKDTSTDTAESAAEELPDFSEAGPYAPGTLEAEITGSTGVELTVQVWFPADEAGSTRITYDGILDGEATTDVTPSCAAPRPVLVFSHGNAGIRWQSPFLTEHIASHGYIVVAPDHTDNTIFDNDDDLFDEVLLRRPQDLSDSFDWLVAQSADPDSALYGCVDESAGFAVSGHSFGGYTTYAIAGATVNDPAGGTVELSDERVWAAAPLAPWDAWGALTDGTAGVTVPVMCLSGTRDETTPWSMVTGMYDQLTVTPRYLGELPEAGHFSFSPVACQLGSTGDGCGDDFIDLDLFTSLIRTSVLAFLEDVRGTQGAIEQLPLSEDLIWESTE